MKNSLRLRLLAALVLVLAVALGLMALFINRSTSSEFQDYVSQSQSLNLERLGDRLHQEYASAGNWNHVQALIEPLGTVVNAHILVLDANHKIVADSQNRLIGTTVDTSFPPAGPRPISIITAPDGSVAGFLLVFPSRNSPEDNFIANTNNSLLLAGLIAAVAALLLTLLLSRGILRPIEALTRAARRMERGDLSQRVTVKTHDEIGTLATAFNNMADGLARQEELRRNMVGDVTHELRTPLANLRGYLEALQDGVIEPDLALMASLHEETILLSHLVEDLQELALAEARQLRLVEEPVVVAPLITQVTNTFQQTAAEKEVALRLDLTPGLPTIFVDPTRVGQVLRNLLNNALTHTPSGGTITVGARYEGNMVRVTVRDTGSGIAPEHLPHIFDRFYRADPSRTRATGGAGLGLAIVKQLVEMQGGTVSVSSVPDEGATFSFTLPTYHPGKTARRPRPNAKTPPLLAATPSRLARLRQRNAPRP